MFKSSKPNDNQSIFEEKNIYILPNGIGKKRIDLFQSLLLKNGANLIDENNESNEDCLIIYDETTFKQWDQIDKTLCKKKFYQNLSNKQFVNTLWLSECLKTKTLINTQKYELKPVQLKRVLSVKQETVLPESTKILFKSNVNKRPVETDSDNEDSKRSKNSLTKSIINDILNNSDKDSSESEYFSADESMSPVKKKINLKTFTCAYSSNEQRINHNKNLTDKLEELSSIYDKTKDKFRALSYQKAIAALKRCDKSINSFEEAIKIPGIGRHIAEKIAEIAQTGELQKLEYLNKRDDLNSIKIFSDVHGVGPTTAQAFVNQGFRTLEDLKTKATLTRQQKIGIKYYDEFKQRIPRSEVVEIERIVKENALSINPGLIVETCGSYRRGKPTCGDVDILITHPDGHSHKTIFNKLLDLLHNLGFLTDDLVVQDEHSDSQRKYLGVCKLLGDNYLHRRLDIIIVPFGEYACALLYFTGSAHFNRSMRCLARQNGMSLSEHSLNKNVKRKGNDKVYGGDPIYTPTEEDVFKRLNLTYRKPEERDF